MTLDVTMDDFVLVQMTQTLGVEGGGGEGRGGEGRRGEGRRGGGKGGEGREGEEEGREGGEGGERGGGEERKGAVNISCEAGAPLATPATWWPLLIPGQLFITTDRHNRN